MPDLTFAEIYANANEDDRYALDERAAIYEYDGGFSRVEAEARTAQDWISSHATGQNVE